MTLPYAFEKLPDGTVRLNAAQAAVVQRIYQRYVDGASLGVIATELEANQITAPSGNLKWSRSVIDEILSNGKYVPYAIPMELFIAVQFEKNSRSNTQVNGEGSLQRKTTRYNSQNVLSGLLVCAECGSNYPSEHGVEHLRLFLYNEGVIGLTWALLDYHIRCKNCQLSRLFTMAVLQ